MSARDRETRDRLLHAAARLFASRGFKRVTIRDRDSTEQVRVPIDDLLGEIADRVGF